MLGKIICALLLLGGVFFVVLEIKDRFSDGLLVITGIILLLIGSVYLGVDWYGNKVALPEENKAVVVSLQETKKLIQTDKQWNLEDIEIHKRVSDLIWRKEEMKARARKARRNPFVIFKPEELK